jgi:hypothetical protein
MWGFLAAVCLGLSFNNQFNVDLIEYNHVKNKHSEYSQIIFWKEYEAVGLNKTERRAIGWFLVDLNPVEKNGLLYRVQYKNCDIVSRHFRETWSETDPERESTKKHWGGNPPNFLK